MPEHLLDHLDVGAARNRQARGGVPELVRVQVGYADRPCCRGECCTEGADPQRLTVPDACEDQVVDAVVLFTGDSQVTIAVADSSLEEKLRIARKIRPVGAQQGATSLEPPTPRMLAYVEKHCVPAR